jgi:hypothetical protein
MRHLELLNAFLALQFEQPGYPACLLRCGYRTYSIGVSMRLPDRTLVVPDVVVSSERIASSLLVEIKGGRQLKGGQLERMTQVTAEHLRDLHYMPVQDPARHRVHVLYFCNEADREALAAALDGRQASVMGFDGERFRISGAALPDPDLEACLSSAVVAAGGLPLDIVPYDDESSDAEVARAILPVVVDLWLRGAGRVTAEDVFHRTHDLVDQNMRSTGAGSERPRIVKRVKRVLRALADGELAEWLQLSHTEPTSWNFLRSTPDPSDRTRELKRLGRAARAYLERTDGPQLGLPFEDEP